MLEHKTIATMAEALALSHRGNCRRLQFVSPMIQNSGWELQLSNTIVTDPSVLIIFRKAAFDFSHRRHSDGVFQRDPCDNLSAVLRNLSVIRRYEYPAIQESACSRADSLRCCWSCRM